MITGHSCSWCRGMNRNTARWCTSCGHAAHKPRLQCDCPQCQAAPSATDLAQVSPSGRRDGVYTVVGQWLDFEAGTFHVRILPGSVPGTWDYVCQTDGPLRHAFHGQAVIQRALLIWAAPETRSYDAIIFRWEIDEEYLSTIPPPRASRCALSGSPSGAAAQRRAGEHRTSRRGL